MKFVRLTFLEQIIILGIRSAQRQFDRSRLGWLWIPTNYLVHVILIGLVFKFVWQDDTFLLFFSYSYLTWRLLIDPSSEGANFWRAAHSQVWNIGVQPNILVGAWLISDLLKLFLWLIPTLIFTYIFLGNTPINFFSFILSIVFIRIIGFQIGYILSFLTARFWDLSHAVGSLIFMAYLVTPVLWNPSRLDDNHKWLVELNPLYYFMELPRNLALGYEITSNIYVVSFILLTFLTVLSIYIHRRYSNSVIMWVS